MAAQFEGSAAHSPQPHEAAPAQRARRDRSEADLDAFKTRLACWAKTQHDADEFNQHHTQVDAIQKLVGTAADGLAGSVSKSKLAQPSWDAHEACRLFDLRLVWLHRVWDFFRDKLEQRARSDYGDTLVAADQVVWSCHSEPLARAEPLGAPSQAAIVPLEVVP